MSFDPYTGAVFLTKALALSTCVALIFRAKIRSIFLRLIGAVIVVLFLGNLCVLFPAEEFGFDYSLFWKIGQDVLAGQDPYASERFVEHPFANPPTALPLFAAFALLPYRTSLAIWTISNTVICLALALVAQRTLLCQDQSGDPRDRTGHASWVLSPAVIMALTAALAVSDASLVGFYIGQVSLLAALALVAAILAQSRGKPIWAGIWLSLATIKVGTMLPFLFLFHRKSDLLTWLSLTVIVLGLCLVTGAVTDLPDRLNTWLDRINDLAHPGQVNDYSFQGTQPENIIGFDHALFRLGLRDRQVIRLAQYMVLLVLGAWVTHQVIFSHRIPRAASCSLVALYSTVFLYHRNYDGLILVLPLVYSVGRARSAQGPARWLFVGTASAILLVLYSNKALLQAAQRLSMTGAGWGLLVQAMILPYATWLVLVAMICLVCAVCKDQAGIQRINTTSK